MKNLITAHIKDTTWICQAERETRANAVANKMIKLTIAAAVLACSTIIGLSFANTHSGPNTPVAVSHSDNETISLTIATSGKCEIGEYVAEKTGAGEAQFGCWMQPNRSIVQLRWTTNGNGPEFAATEVYSITKFSQTKKGDKNV